jgi:DNA-binding transcriptional MerR regulator
MTADGGSSASGRRTGKSEAAFRTISEVAEDLDVPQHVLRFWESKFPQVKPLKRGGGRRYYRPEDVALLRRIRDLLYSEGYTIKGVQKLLREGGGKDTGAAAAKIQPELVLPLGEPSAPSAEPLPAEEEEGECAVDEFVLTDGDASEDTDSVDHSLELLMQAPLDGGISVSVRLELQELLGELEQIRQLLQPRS